MKFKLDENLPIEVRDDLRSAGHDAVTVADQQLAGQPDVKVAGVCRSEGRAVLTLDLDFSDIRAYPPSDYAGIIVLRPAAQSIKYIEYPPPHSTGHFVDGDGALTGEPVDRR